MANFIKTQNSFAHGAVAPEFFAHDDINGVSRLENMDVLPGGGLTRRRGLAHVAALSTNARLVPFSVSETENYLLAITPGHVIVYLGTTVKADLFAPWTSDDLSRLQYAQRFDTIIFVHPDYQPQILQKTKNGFELVDFIFARNDTDMSMNIPFMRFEDNSYE